MICTLWDLTVSQWYILDILNALFEWVYLDDSEQSWLWDNHSLLWLKFLLSYPDECLSHYILLFKAIYIIEEQADTCENKEMIEGAWGSEPMHTHISSTVHTYRNNTKHV